MVYVTNNLFRKFLLKPDLYCIGATQSSAPLPPLLCAFTLCFTRGLIFFIRLWHRMLRGICCNMYLTAYSTAFTQKYAEFINLNLFSWPTIFHYIYSADSPLLWIRIDPDMSILRKVEFEQADFMWQYQLRYERDVVAQVGSLQVCRVCRSHSLFSYAFTFAI